MLVYFVNIGIHYKCDLLMILIYFIYILMNKKSGSVNGKALLITSVIKTMNTGCYYQLMIAKDFKMNL